MRRYSLLSLLLFALAIGLILVATSIAGQKCGKAGDGAACAPCPGTGTTVSATAASAPANGTSASTNVTPSANMRSNHSQVARTQSSAAGSCVGSSCKPGQMCNGKPCVPCKPGDCKGANGQCSTASKPSI